MALEIPREKQLDSTRTFLAEGYPFISRRCERLGTNIFEARLMLKKVYCVRGEEAARMFYTPERFTRRGAVPPTTLLLLQDVGSVQTLNGADHRHRKAMFMSMMSPESVQRLGSLVENGWRSRYHRWEAAQDQPFHRIAQEVLCEAACTWAGVPLSRESLKKRTREFAAMVERAGSFGPSNWRAIRKRRRTERWAQDLIERVRAGELRAPEGSAIAAIAGYKDLKGRPLPAKVARVELLNVLRPIVAVARYLTFCVLALHKHPAAAEALRGAGDDAAFQRFAQEVRRYYPFFPVIGGRAREAFEWQGHRFPAKTWFLLDLYGTNRDPASWDAPDTFRPERFRNWDSSPYNLIPQGAGDARESHRCPGETLTLEAMKRTLRLFLGELPIRLPAQDLGIDLSRFPTLPASGLLVRKAEAA